MLQQEFKELLGRIHPFDLLPAAAIEELSRDAGLEYFRRGTAVLAPGGQPAEHLFVVKRGTVSMFLVADDGSELVIDYRGVGEYFGLLSVISDEPPRSHVRAEEDSICLLIPKPALRAVLDEHPAISDMLLKSYFLEFVDKTYEESRRRYSGMTNGHRLLFATPVGQLVHREPVATGDGTSIQQAARLMVEQGISSLVVTDGSGRPVGIMTDRDLREKAVAEGRDLSQPVRTIMSSPIVHVDAGEPCSEALFKMMRHNLHHVPVTEGGKFRGMVTSHDFMVLQGSSPTLLVKKVLETVSLEHLEQAGERLVTTVAVLSREGARAHDVSRVITEVARQLVVRTTTLVESELGAPSSPLTVALHGEAGRSELSLRGGPGLAVIWDLPAAAGEPAGAYARHLQARFAAPPVSAALAEGAPISLAAWRELLLGWVAGESPEPVAGADLFEMTGLCGGVRALEALRLELVEAAAGNEAFLGRLASAALSQAPPLGFLGRLVVATTGEHRNELDLYRGGIEPLVAVVRVLALERGLEARSTLGRLRELRAQHGYARAEEIENALDYLQTLRIHQQLAQLEAGERADDFVDPETLADRERKSLKETFQLIAALHDSLSRRYGVEAAPG